MDLIHVGVGTHVVALRPEDGSEVWRVRLGLSMGGDVVTLLRSGGRLLAGIRGEVYCLDPTTGSILWHSALRKCGMGFVTFAAPGPEATLAARSAQDAQAGALAAAMAATAIAGSD